MKRIWDEIGPPVFGIVVLIAVWAIVAALTDTRGVRRCPASFHASWYASICLRCWMCSGSPLSSSFSVEL